MLRISLARWKGVVFYWDTIMAIVVGGLLGGLPDYVAKDWLFWRLLWIEIAAASALLGIVLAGIAITLSLMRDELLEFLAQQGRGLREEVWPFWFTAVLAVAAILSGLVSIALFTDAHIVLVRGAVAVVTFLATWAVMSVLSLIDVLAGYAEIRVAYGKYRRELEAGLGAESLEAPAGDDSEKV